jgi:hypothetical protein
MIDVLAGLKVTAAAASDAQPSDPEVRALMSTLDAASLSAPFCEAYAADTGPLVR